MSFILLSFLVTAHFYRKKLGQSAHIKISSKYADIKHCLKGLEKY